MCKSKLLAGAIQSILITGANGGIGMEVARQLGTRPATLHVVLACRNRQRAERARAELVATTGRSIFEILALDTADPVSAHAAARSLPEPVDALVMNAGGTGGRTPAALTSSGATRLFAVNVLGHVALFDELVAARKLRGVAVMTGSEAARGAPQLLIRRPSFVHTSVDELASAIDGSYFARRRFDAALAYAQTKYIGALWIGAMARQHPKLRLATMSPGGTAGTGIGADMPAVQRLVFERLVMGRLGARLGMAHSVQTGAARLVRAVTDPSCQHGAFYASRRSRLTGDVVDQASIFPDLANPAFQDHANEAIHRFLPASG